MSLLGGAATDAHDRHPATPWRPQVLRRLLQRADDPDVDLWKWFTEGAPLGISQPITPGGLLPIAPTHATLSATELLDSTPWSGNHGSFEQLWEDEAGGRAAQHKLS